MKTEKSTITLDKNLLPFLKGAEVQPTYNKGTDTYTLESKSIVQTYPRTYLEENNIKIRIK